jgi:hypothetical protein
MVYLVCDECGGYYELQEGESPDDFDFCHCGGELSLLKTANDNMITNRGSLTENKRINWLGVAIGSLFFFLSCFSVIMMGLVLSFQEINVILIALSIISGFIASFMGKIRDYTGGALNGFVVGFIWGLILILIIGFYSVYVMMMIFAAFGGVMGVFLIRNLDKKIKQEN